MTNGTNGPARRSPAAAIASALRGRAALSAACAAFVLAALAACDEGVYTGTIKPNVPPTIKLTSGPPEGDTIAYTIRFSWVGNDRDGTVDHYEFAMCAGNPLGFNPADTTGLEKWTKTRRMDSVFKFRADEEDRNIKYGTSYFTQYRKTHTFFVRSVDDRGGRSDPAYSSFTAQTLAPYAVITVPKNPFPGQSQIVPPVVRFQWYSRDPIDVPWNTQDADSIRYMLVPFYRTVLDDINANPAAFEHNWRPWLSYAAPGDSGISTVIGDDEILNKQNSFVFAVQAKDEAGAVTTIFDPKTNVRVFAILQNAGPILRAKEPYLGRWQYLGINNRPEVFRLPAGFELNFSWEADASNYGGEIASYRYGWDISDINDPNEWAVDPSPFVKSAPPISFLSGVHTLFIEAVDNNDVATIAQMEINTFSLNMTRNLLWVDDFYSTDLFQNLDNAFPTETEHDNFWLAVCGRAAGFSPSLDVFDTAARNHEPPDIELLWRYKNVIWSYSALDEINAWDNMVRFTPESAITSTTILKFNFLSYYMASGGHIWTEGKSDKNGGLIAVLYPPRQIEPINLRCEITGVRVGCDGDTSGVNSIAYKDYCVSVLDKIVPTPRIDPRMPARRADWDAMTYAYRDARDPVTTAHAALPASLELWSRATAPGMFFDPQVRGFTYGEIYNPGYWMSVSGVRLQSCFHPMYRMRTRSTLSAIDNVTVAFWTTKHAGVTAPVDGAVAAPSVHFGVPLWFFNRAQVDSIADAVFTAWGINGR